LFAFFVVFLQGQRIITKSLPFGLYIRIFAENFKTFKP